MIQKCSKAALEAKTRQILTQYNPDLLDTPQPIPVMDIMTAAFAIPAPTNWGIMCGTKSFISRRTLRQRNPTKHSGLLRKTLTPNGRRTISDALFSCQKVSSKKRSIKPWEIKQTHFLTSFKYLSSQWASD